MFQNVCFVVITSETGKTLILATNAQPAVFSLVIKFCMLLKSLKMRLMWKILLRLSFKSIVLLCLAGLSESTNL